jgi:hypothetical protein
MTMRFRPNSKSVRAMRRSASGGARIGGGITRSLLAGLAALALLSGGAPPARAGMVLTPAAQAAGFRLATFASGFPTDLNEGNGSVGPLGVAFLSAGGVLVSDAPGNIRRFPSDTDGQNAGSVAPLQFYGHNNAAGLAQVGSAIYMTQQVLGQVVQVNPDGTINQLIAAVPNATGLVADPATGHLLVSSQSTNRIYEVEPIAKTAHVLLSGVPGPDGVTITSDGLILYTAATGAGGGGHILGYSTATKTLVFDSGPIPGIDGVTLGTGSLAGNVFGNTNFGNFDEVNLATAAQTLIGTNGSRGDFVEVDTTNGTLLVTQTDSILRLTAPPGGGFGPGVPEPGSLSLLGLGLAGSAVHGWWRLKRASSRAGCSRKRSCPLCAATVMQAGEGSDRTRGESNRREPAAWETEVGLSSLSSHLGGERAEVASVRQSRVSRPARFPSLLQTRSHGHEISLAVDSAASPAFAASAEHIPRGIPKAEPPAPGRGPGVALPVVADDQRIPCPHLPQRSDRHRDRA